METEKILTEIAAVLNIPLSLLTPVYGETLANFLTFICQKDPALKNITLNLTLAALKLRRGKLLVTSDSGVETMASEEALWTYAIFSAILLQKCLFLVKNEDERVIIDSLVPLRCQQWLKSNTEIYRCWYEAVFFPGANNVIVRIITQTREQWKAYFKEASEESEILENDGSDKVVIATPEVLLVQLQEWLMAHLSGRGKSTAILKLSAGLFITDSLIESFCTEMQFAISVEDLWRTLDFCLVETPLQQKTWTLRRKELSDPCRLIGKVIGNVFLIAHFQALPETKDFMVSHIL